MRELDVVIARVPTVLRPQIQEAASPLNSWLWQASARRQQAARAERESTAQLYIPMAAVMWVPG